jgi:signal transduction histidine kinase
MNRFKSLRWQIVIGTAAWTAGLVFLVNWVSLTIIRGRGGMHLHIAAMLLLAVGAMAAGLWQVRRSVSSLNRLRAKLSAVHDGRQARLDGTYPLEVQPLVDDLNTLLAHREQAVSRAIAKAGDLAHGLKTPLAVLAQEAERAGAAGHHELAASIAQQVERMRRQVDYHLAHARAAASGAAPGAICHVRESAEGLARTLLRLHADRKLAIDVSVSADHVVRVQREDLDEMLGNLLDNACKWTRTHVAVTSNAAGGETVIAVEDDGPGVEPAMRDHVLRRGVRADEAAPGSGFGLAIVRELAELYSGSISLSTAHAGGLRAELRLPNAHG